MQMIISKIVKAIIVCLVSFISIGCAYTDISSRVNREYSTKTYRNILLITEFDSIQLAKSIENQFATSLEDFKANCFLGYDLFFPGNEYSDQECSDILKANNIDAILVIYQGECGTNKIHIPSVTTSETKGRVTEEYNGSYSFKSSTKTNNGYDISKPWSNATCELYDANDGQMVWMASAQASGNAFANFRTLARSIGKKVVLKLVDDGLLKRQ